MGGCQKIQLAVEMCLPQGKRAQNGELQGLKTFLDQLIQAGHLKEFVDQEKTKVDEAEVIPTPRFDCDRDEADDALEEDLPLETIHIIGGLKHPDIEIRIRGEIHILRKMHKVLSV